MEENQQYQVRVSGLPHNVSEDQYSTLFGAYGNYIIIQKNNDNLIGDPSDNTSQILLQYESLIVAQAAKSSIQDTQIQNSKLSAELIVVPQQTNHQSFSTTSNSAHSQQTQQPDINANGSNQSSTQLSSPKSSSRSTTPKQTHTPNSNQLISSSSNQGDTFQNNISGNTNNTNNNNARNQKQLYQNINNDNSSQSQNSNVQNNFVQQQYKVISPLKNSGPQLYQSPEKENLNDNQQNLQTNEPNQRDQQNSEIMQTQSNSCSSREEKIIVSVQQPAHTVKQTLTIVKQDKNLNISNGGNSNGRSITTTSLQGNTVSTPIATPTGTGGARVITIKKKEQGPKLIDKLIIKQKPSQNDLEGNKNTPIGSLENLNLTITSQQQNQQPQQYSQNIGFKAQSNQIINGTGSNNGSQKPTKILRISQRDNDTINAFSTEERDIINQGSNNLNIQNPNNYNNNQFNKKIPDNNFQSKAEFYKNRYQISQNSNNAEDKYGYYKNLKQNNNSQQNFPIQMQEQSQYSSQYQGQLNDFNIRKQFNASSQQQLNVQIQQQQQHQQPSSSQQQQQQQQQQQLSQSSSQQLQSQLQQQQQQQNLQINHKFSQYSYANQQYNSNSYFHKQQSVPNKTQNSLIGSLSQQNIIQPPPIIDTQAEKKRLHRLIHERVKLVHRRHLREKQKKYHCLHIFHRINCHTLQGSTQNYGDSKPFPDYLRRMDYLQFTKYYRSKLERSSSQSIEREFFLNTSLIPMPQIVHSSIRKRSNSPQRQNTRDNQSQQYNFQNQKQQQYPPNQQYNSSISNYSQQKKEQSVNINYNSNQPQQQQQQYYSPQQQQFQQPLLNSQSSRDPIRDSRDFPYQYNQSNVSQYTDKQQYNQSNIRDNQSPIRGLRDNYKNQQFRDQPYQGKKFFKKEFPFQHDQRHSKSKSRSRDSRSFSNSRYNQFKGNNPNFNGKQFKNFDKKVNKYSPRSQRNGKYRDTSRSTSQDSKKGQAQQQHHRFNRNDEEGKKFVREDFNGNKRDYYSYKNERYNDYKKTSSKHNKNVEDTHKQSSKIQNESQENAQIKLNQQQQQQLQSTGQENKNNSKSPQNQLTQKENDEKDKILENQILAEQYALENQKSTFSDVDDYHSPSADPEPPVKISSIQNNSAQKKQNDDEQLDYSSDHNL